VKLNGNRCKCGGCGRYFNSTSAFDRHRSGKPSERVCLDPESLGMEVNGAGLWITGALPTVPAFLARRKREKTTISATYPTDTPELERA
jgi:hypothetical protein